MSSLPVLLRVEPALGGPLRRHLESVLGWQVVDDELAGLVRPVVELSDGTSPTSGGRPDLPVVQVVDDAVGPVAAAQRGAALRPAAVLAWPGDRDRLPELVEVARLAPPVASPPEPPASRLVVAGAAGGVGTTTVALALAGIEAWAGQEVFVIVRGDVPLPDVPCVDAPALRGPAAWNAAAMASGVPGMRVLVAGRGDAADLAGVGAVEAPPGVRLVVDAGTERSVADVLVARRDRAGREALQASAAGAIVLVDDGPVPEADLLRGVSGRTVAVVPWSARVARAGVARRVPAGLPGSWLEPLRALAGPDLGAKSTDGRIGRPDVPERA